MSDNLEAGGAQRRKDFAPKAALLLCREEEVRAFLSYWLKEASIEVTVAHNGKEAAERIAEGGIDVLLIDRFPVPPPGLSSLLDLKAGRRLKIVLIAGGGEETQPALARVFGVDAVVQRPVRHAPLMLAVEAPFE